MSPFRIRLKGMHTNNTSLPKIQPDPTVNPGTVLIYDWSIPYTYNLPAVPANGTAVVAGTTFQSLIPGGNVATELFLGGTGNIATQYWGGNGIRFPLTQRSIGLGAASKFVPASINEFVVIAWFRVLVFNQGQIMWYGLGDGVSNSSGAGNYGQYYLTQASTATAPPGNAPLNTSVQFCEHRRWDGTTAGSFTRRWVNVTAITGATQYAQDGNLTAMPPANGCTINTSQATLGHTSNVGASSCDFVYHRIAIHNIQTSGGLTADTIVANDFAMNYGRFLP